MLKPACTWSDTTTAVWCGCSVTLDVDIVAGVGCYMQLRPVNACGLSRVFLLLLCRAAAGRAGLAAAGCGVAKREALCANPSVLAPTTM